MVLGIITSPMSCCLSLSLKMASIVFTLSMTLGTKKPIKKDISRSTWRQVFLVLLLRRIYKSISLSRALTPHLVTDSWQWISFLGLFIESLNMEMVDSTNWFSIGSSGEGSGIWKNEKCYSRRGCESTQLMSLKAHILKIYFTSHILSIADQVEQSSEKITKLIICQKSTKS